MRAGRALTPRAALRAGGVSAIVIALSLVMTGCPTSVDWSDFRGVNLIEGRHFGADDGTGLVWGSISGDFVRFEEASSDAPPLPSEVSPTASVYRLELLNLIPNGDFEDSSVTDPFTHWTETGNSNAEIVTADSFNSSPEADGIPLVALHGDRVLSLNFEDRLARYFIDLRSTGPLTVPGAFAASAQFALFVDFRTSYENFSLTLNRPVTGVIPTGADETDEQNDLQINRGDSTGATTTYRYPGALEDDPAQASPARNTMTVPEDAGASLFSFGGATFTAGQRNQLIADNIRLVRSDLEHGIRVVVPQFDDPLQPGRPDLVAGGRYTFSVWIGRDTTTGSANRFDPEFLTVRIAAHDTDVSNGDTFITGELKTAQETLPDLANWGAPSDPTTGGWTLLEYTFDGPLSPSFEIQISIVFGDGADPESLSPGSILVTDPRLEYRPE